MIALRALGVLVGCGVALATVLSAVRTTVLPRGVPSRVTRLVFVLLRLGFQARVGRAATYTVRDRVFANYGPYALLLLLQVWLFGVYGGFALAQWAGSPSRGAADALKESGSALTTVGFDAPSGALATTLSFAEASAGLLLVALLISYLPAIYGAFSRREALVTKLEVRAGDPPTGSEMLRRAWVLGRMEALHATWLELETWFGDIEETHTSFAALVFFRSPQPDHSWVTAAGAGLDSASLLVSCLDLPPSAEAQLCIRSGYLSLRQIAGYFQIPFPRDPRPDDPITVTRAEWEDVVTEMAAAGLPVKADRDQAWRDFAGWRVNYDYCLVALAALAQAPYAPWSSDRSVAGARPPRVFLRRPHDSVGAR